jgi:hypothetical protein
LQYAFDASTKWLRNGNPLNVHNKQLIQPGAAAQAQTVGLMLPPACGMIRSGLCRLRGPRHKGTFRRTLKGNRHG